MGQEEIYQRNHNFENGQAGGNQAFLAYENYHQPLTGSWSASGQGWSGSGQIDFGSGNPYEPQSGQRIPGGPIELPIYQQGGGYEPQPYQPGGYGPMPFQPGGAYEPLPYQPGGYEPSPYQPGGYGPLPFQPGGAYEPLPYQPGGPGDYPGGNPGADYPGGNPGWPGNGDRPQFPCPQEGGPYPSEPKSSGDGVTFGPTAQQKHSDFQSDVNGNTILNGENGLSSDQKTQIQGIEKKYDKEDQPLQKDIQQKEKELKGLSLENFIGGGQEMMKLYADIQADQTKLDKNYKAEDTSIYNDLNPDQQLLVHGAMEQKQSDQTKHLPVYLDGTTTWKPDLTV